MLIDSPGPAAPAAPHHVREPKIAGIEMLRAVAVLMVMVQHLPGMLPELGLLWLPGRVLANFNGGAGVDIFFCISGFVVARSLLRDVRGLDRRAMVAVAAGFWIRRAFRLWPSAWIWLFVAYAVSLGFNRLGVMDPWANLRMIPAGIGMYANYLLMHASRAHQNLGVMSQYWSLSLEEQFYLVLPALLIVGRRAALPLLALYAGYLFFDYRDFWADLYLRPGCLVAGVALAYLEGGPAWRRVQRVLQPGFAGVPVCATLVLLAAVFDSIAPFERWFGVAMFRFSAALETLACGALVLVAVQCSPHTNPNALGRILMFLGSRSYAIYIVHQLAYAVTREIDSRLFTHANSFGLRVGVAVVVAGMLIFVATEITVRFVEQPLRLHGRVIADRVLAQWLRKEAARATKVDVRQHLSNGSAQETYRIADIEALRTIAIVFVMIQHVTNNLVFQPRLLLSLLEYGQLWPGVDLFFVISGFLVTGDLLRRFDAERVSDGTRRIIRGFWFRRAWRLWPTAWLWLLLIIFTSTIVNPPFLGPVMANLRGGVAGVLFFANYRLAEKTIHFQPYGASYPYWSLSLEEQFYFLLPLAVKLLGRFLPLALCLGILVQLPLAHNTYYFLFRSDGLLWGVALAIWARTDGYRMSDPHFLKPRLAGTAFLLLALAAIFQWATTGNASPPFAIGGISAVAALLVWVASYDRNYICPRLTRPLVLWAGSRSYALYVAHVPIFQCSAALAHHFFSPASNIFKGDSDSYAVVIAVPLLLTAVEMSHRVVERPLRSFGRRLAERSYFAST